MWFDVQAALAEIESAFCATTAKPPRHVAHVAHVARPPAPKSERDMSSKRICNAAMNDIHARASAMRRFSSLQTLRAKLTLYSITGIEKSTPSFTPLGLPLMTGTACVALDAGRRG
jgi:hypothetical protein